jgi:hypothetical protein
MKIAAKILFAGATVLAGFACLLVLVEARFKLLSNCELSAIAYDQNLGWTLARAGSWNLDRPNSEKLNNKVTTNSKGFRDGEHLIAKQPGHKRIMFVGDSYTAGLHYPNEKIFTQRFAQALDQLTALKNRFEIMNVAVPAWATDQQYLYLRDEGMKYDPDYVFLMIAPNDIRESRGKQFFFLGNEGLTEKGPPSVPWQKRLYWFLANHSCAFQYGQSKSKSNYGSFADIFQYFPVSFPVGSEISSDKHLFLQDSPREIQTAKELFKALLLKINRLCDEHHCKLLLSIIPTKIEYDGSLKEQRYHPGAIAEYVETLANEKNIPFLNLVRALDLQEKEPMKIFISSEYHLNDYGHAFVANNLVPFFISNQ